MLGEQLTLLDDRTLSQKSTGIRNAPAPRALSARTTPLASPVFDLRAHNYRLNLGQYFGTVSLAMTRGIKNPPSRSVRNTPVSTPTKPPTAPLIPAVGGAARPTKHESGPVMAEPHARVPPRAPIKPLSSNAGAPQPPAAPQRVIPGLAPVQPAVSSAQSAVSVKRGIIPPAPIAQVEREASPAVISKRPETPSGGLQVVGGRRKPGREGEVVPGQTVPAVEAAKAGVEQAVAGTEQKVAGADQRVAAVQPKVVSKPEPVRVVPREQFLQCLVAMRPQVPRALWVMPELVTLRVAQKEELDAIASGYGRGRPHGHHGGSGGRYGSSAHARGGKRDQRHGFGGGRFGGKGASDGRPLAPLRILKASEKGFKIADKSTLAEEVKFKRSVMAYLNKVSPDNAKHIIDQMAENVKVSESWHLDVAVQALFAKALVEHTYSDLYADICVRLNKLWPEITLTDETTGETCQMDFRDALITKCQEEFSAMPPSFAPSPEDLEKAKGDTELVEMLVTKRKERVLGNMKFLASLYMKGVVSSRVVCTVTHNLLFQTEEPESHYVESFCVFLFNTGSKLNGSDSGRRHMDSVKSRIADLSKSKNYESRIRYMLLDVLDCFAKGWQGVSTRHTAKAKSKEEMAEAAAQAAQATREHSVRSQDVRGRERPETPVYNAPAPRKVDPSGSVSFASIAAAGSSGAPGAGTPKPTATASTAPSTGTRNATGSTLSSGSSGPRRPPQGSAGGPAGGSTGAGGLFRSRSGRS